MQDRHPEFQRLEDLAPGAFFTVYFVWNFGGLRFFQGAYIDRTFFVIASHYLRYLRPNNTEPKITYINGTQCMQKR